MPVSDAGPNRWVGGWSERRAQLSPEKVGLVDATTDQSFTYAELDARANRTARLLRQYGVETGERVAVISRNRPELVDLFFATAKTGGVLAPLSHRLAAPEIAELLTTVDPKLLVIESPFVELVADARAADAFDTGPSILVLSADDAGNDSDDLSDAPAFAAVPTFASALPDDASDPSDDASTPSDNASTSSDDASDPSDDASPAEHTDVSMDDPHLFLHTGGSTGTPKETVLTHEGILWNSFNTITAWGLCPEDTTPMVFPMFHTGGWNVITVPLFHLGGTVVIARDFDPAAVLRLIPKHDASVLIAVPAVLRMMCAHDDWTETDLSTLRFVKSGGGPCRESVMQAWWDRDIDLSQGYGLTECGPNNFAMPDGWPHEKADSVGVPAMHVDARVVDDDGNELQGEVGELELSGPHAARKYWNAPEETRETFDDGWVSTGDLARVDDDGYVHIEGRKKNMFVSGGENVYPPEVEDAVTAHPKVEDAVVIGIPDERWGQVGRAVVQGDDSVTVEELSAFLDDRLARFKQPKSVVFVDEMPMSGPSKIDRQALKDRFGGG
ncbi:acyl-CoA synthetase (AMP-forming)/AMP-acid ligase II [Halogeometricum borinquense DSM 11551]|uniref:Acyl-CoA synthetase (AMP-forming)/AMP-acid ligase II n=1 Tax=Halogeometricum borinquense (strain ATCC 700274 / DSM 11551 / JCM 10706 / KCTC 4070 / PR3) TaxID=469382 RepID=E4NTK1_HALBP|nr:acyl-CoA synthetase (AMP-forming)/AMP-acid ligase II [Halogeometricum borinquense DSM 11551]